MVIVRSKKQLFTLKEGHIIVRTPQSTQLNTDASAAIAAAVRAVLSIVQRVRKQ